MINIFAYVNNLEECNAKVLDKINLKFNKKIKKKINSKLTKRPIYVDISNIEDQLNTF
jgi:hypothetical protein